MADVVPGQSYVGTDTHYFDQLEPEFVEDVLNCTMAVEATADDVRDDCQYCIFAFEVHIGTPEPVGGCEYSVSSPPRHGYGVRGTTASPTLMVLWEGSDGLQEWWAEESPEVTVTFDGTRFTFDHYFERVWDDDIPE
ncbi:MAG: hypothetical protein JRI25_10500 [Deltaproteobacteria bacterium]|nr:hypothetical protein [Deltaproteobacteria bacterium]